MTSTRENEARNEAAPDMQGVWSAPETAFLSSEQFDRESGYRMALSIMKGWLQRGLLTRREYGQIEQILSEKFSPIWGRLPDLLSESEAKSADCRLALSAHRR